MTKSAAGELGFLTFQNEPMKTVVTLLHKKMAQSCQNARVRTISAGRSAEAAAATCSHSRSTSSEPASSGSASASSEPAPHRGGGGGVMSRHPTSWRTAYMSASQAIAPGCTSARRGTKHGQRDRSVKWWLQPEM